MSNRRGKPPSQATLRWARRRERFPYAHSHRSRHCPVLGLFRSACKHAYRGASQARRNNTSSFLPVSFLPLPPFLSSSRFCDSEKNLAGAVSSRAAKRNAPFARAHALTLVVVTRSTCTCIRIHIRDVYIHVNTPAGVYYHMSSSSSLSIVRIRRRVCMCGHTYTRAQIHQVCNYLRQEPCSRFIGRHAGVVYSQVAGSTVTVRGRTHTNTHICTHARIVRGSHVVRNARESDDARREAVNYGRRNGAADGFCDGVNCAIKLRTMDTRFFRLFFHHPLDT